MWGRITLGFFPLGGKRSFLKIHLNFKSRICIYFKFFLSPDFFFQSQPRLSNHLTTTSLLLSYGCSDAAWYHMHQCLLTWTDYFLYYRIKQFFCTAVLYSSVLWLRQGVTIPQSSQSWIPHLRMQNMPLQFWQWDLTGEHFSFTLSQSPDRHSKKNSLLHYLYERR